MDEPQTTRETPGTERLQLKRVFLRTLIVALSGCALVAAVALLWGRFNETTGRILLTLFSLALHSGLAMFCAATLERRRWPTLSLVGLYGFALNFAVFTVCTWLPGGLGEPAGKAMVTTLVLIGGYIAAIPCALLLEKRGGPWPYAALAGCTLTVLMTLVCIWPDAVENYTFARATASVAIAGGALVHVCVLLLFPGALKQPSLFFGTVAAGFALAILAIAGVWLEPAADLYYRCLGALGVLTAAGTLVLFIMARLRQVERNEGLETVAGRIALSCPRCTESMQVAAGPSCCPACGLKFRIEVEEPRCLKCGYLLWQLPDRRCPECGQEF